MAGDWIKMTHALPEKPEVLAIVAKTGLSRFDVVGRLFVLWRWFDNNTKEGNAAGVTLVTLDECLFGYQNVTKFCQSVAEVGWLVEKDGGVSVPNFDYHISESAKTRAQTSKRVSKSKNKTKESNAKGNADTVTSQLPNALPREEKSKEVNDVFSLMVSDGVSDDIATEYISHKKSVKAKLTARGWKLISGEIKKSGMPIDEALEYAMGKGWKGFEAAWVNGKVHSNDQKVSGWSSAIC